MENENMVAQPKKKSPIMGILISIILIAGAGVLGWYIGQMNSSEVLKEKTECEEKLTLSKTTETVKETRTESKPKCYGTYTEDGTEGNVKWILKEDGTYTVEGKETFGAFFIKDNTITFIEHKHTVGPEDQDPYYTNPQTNLISKDCKNITLGTGEIRAGLTRQD